MLSTVKLILLASSVAAYPWVGEVAAGREVEQRDLAGFLESMALAGDDITHSLDGIIKAANDAKMKQLGGEIKKGVDWIIETANNTPGWPGWPVPSNLNLTAKDITKDLMYATFKLDRSAKPIFPAAEEGHPHVPPGPNDQRGPCPGLNTLANHGYIPHNGIVTPSQLVRAVWEGLSMGPDLGAILAIGGFVFKGDLDTMQMSIGGEVEGAGVGLSQHGIIEGDGSVTRMDSTLGDHIKASQERLKIYYDEIRKFGTDGYDINPTVCAESRYRAYMDSYNNNPSFDFNPNRHLIAYAESGFAMEVFRGANKSCTPETIEYFFSKEQFPPGWHRRNVPITSSEMISWGMLFNSIKPTDPVRGLGTKGKPVKMGKSFLAEGTVGDNIKTFSGTLLVAVPKAMMYMAEAVAPTGLLNGLPTEM